MNEQKAINYLKRKIETENQICALPTCDDEVKIIKKEHIGYMQSAIAALEKQIPKEPLDFEDESYLCPCCKRNNFYKGAYLDKQNHCDYCDRQLNGNKTWI